MFETTNVGTQNPSSALIALKPRQVLLAERNLNTKMKKHSKTLELQPQQKAVLLQSVILFIERNGYSKTLKRLLSEAQIEDDNWKTSSLDLEAIFAKHLETLSQADRNICCSEREDVQADGNSKKDRTSEIVSKKKKQRSDENDKIDAIDENSGALDQTIKFVTNSEEVITDDVATKSGLILKESKKSKKMSNFITEAPTKATDHIAPELQMDELTKKHDSKKKKKTKLTSEPLDGNVELAQLDSLPQVADEKPVDLVSSKDDCKADSGPKRTKDKKKKSKSVTSAVESPGQCGLEDKDSMVKAKTLLHSESGGTGEVPLEHMKTKDRKRKKEDAVMDSQTLEDTSSKYKWDSKKRKRLDSVENDDQTIGEVANEETKRRKTVVSEEAKKNGQFVEGKAPQGGSQHISAQSKTNNGQDSYIQPDNTSVDGTANENSQNNGREKSEREQQNGSAEPKTVNAFQRVKVDQVVFADTRLQDNSYWAKDGAEAGYGAKAQEVLGRVRGRDFRHEKTKKKRGSYRGGQIDLQSHSIKFNYSDEE